MPAMEAARKSESVTYADGATPVLPGDRVSVRLFLRRRAGEVIYVPGISKRRGTYEHHGLTWVGVSLPDGWAIGTIVLPDTNQLQRSVRFIGRGSESTAAARALERIEAQEKTEEDEAADVAPDELSAVEPAGRPTPADWLAGFVAIALKLGSFLLVIGLIAASIGLLRRLF